MTAPKRWKESPPTDGDAAKAARLVAAVEPPLVPSAARARVRERLGLRRARPGIDRRWLWAGTATAVTVLLLVVATRWGPTSTPEDVVVWRTGRDSRQAIDLAEWGRFDLGPASELQRRPTVSDGAIELRLGRGTVKVRTVADNLRLIAGRYAVTPSAGAIFQVRASPFFTAVDEGSVDVRGPTGTARLRSGERFDASAAAVPTDPPEPVQIAGESPRPETALPRRLVAQRRSAERRAAERKLKGAPRKAVAATRRAEPVDDSKAAGPEPGAPRPASGAEDFGALYRRARSMQDAEAAVAAFDRVMRSSTEWAEMAGHQAVRRRIAQRRYRDALRRLDALELRFPDGAHGPEVWLSRIEVRVELGALADARGDLDRYLAAHPNSLRASDLYYLRGELHRQAGHLDAARRDYRRVIRGRFVSPAREALLILEKK